MPASGETARHASLKQLALRWACEQGLTLAAPEVSFPHRRFRVDVAACRPARAVPSRPAATSVHQVLRTAAVFECKQVRGDLLRDNARRDGASLRLRELETRRRELESRLQLHLPHLAQGESLFPEFDSYRLRDCGHGGYRRLVQRIATARQALTHGTKFDRLAGYRLANVHYLVVEASLVEPHELPPGWGLLVRDGEVLRLAQKPAWQDIAAEEQLIFLQRIAYRAASARRGPTDRALKAATDGTTGTRPAAPESRSPPSPWPGKTRIQSQLVRLHPV